MARTVRQETEDLFVRLMDGGLPEPSARREAERITDMIWNAALDAAADTIRPDGVSYPYAVERNEIREEAADDIIGLKK